MKKQLQNHGCQLSSLEINFTEHRKTIHELQREVEGLKSSLEKALNSLMPKVDSLLSDRTTTVSTVSASVAVAPSAAASNAKEESKLPLNSSTTGASAASVFQAADIETLLSHLKSGTSANQRDEKGFTLLHLAVSGGQEKTVKALLDAGALVNAIGPSFTTSLHLAVEKGFVNIVEMLLVAGADINAHDNNDITPLLLAAKEGHLVLVKLLIKRGASLDECDNRIKTTLWYAVERGANDIVKLLCDKGASGSLGQCPLRLASERGNTEAVMFLLESNNPPNKIEITKALSVAKSIGIVWAFEDSRPGILISRQPEVAMQMAAADGRFCTLKAFLDVGIHVNARDAKCGRTALYWAKLNKRTECIKLLSERGGKL